MSEIDCAQLHSELFRRKHSTRQSHGLFALAKPLYSMYGFDNGYTTLTELYNSFDIIAVEEQWLAPYNLDKLRNFDSNFNCLCWSSMPDKTQLGLNTGRPFGGIGVLFNKRLDINIRVLNMSNGRCATLRCTFPTGYSLIIAVVYFRCLSSSAEYECELLDCLVFWKRVWIRLCLMILLY